MKSEKFTCLHCKVEKNTDLESITFMVCQDCYDDIMKKNELLGMRKEVKGLVDFMINSKVYYPMDNINTGLIKYDCILYYDNTKTDGTLVFMDNVTSKCFVLKVDIKGNKYRVLQII